MTALGLHNDFFDRGDKGIWTLFDCNTFAVNNGAMTLEGGYATSMARTKNFFVPDRFMIEADIQPFANSAWKGGFLEINSANAVTVGFISYGGQNQVVINGSTGRYLGSGWGHVKIYKENGRILVATQGANERSETLEIDQVWSDGAACLALPSESVSSVTYTLGADFRNLKIRPFKPQGGWASNAVDLTRAPSTVGKISWQQDLPVGTRIEIQTSTSDDNASWSTWSQPYADYRGSVITSPAARYIRVAATLYADSTGENTPVLDEIQVEYPDAAPAGPQITPLSHPQAQWASPTALSLSWAMPAGNPAPESTYAYWLRWNGALTATASASIGEAVGQAHPLSLSLPAEGSYTLDLQVTGDSTSGGLTASAQTYSFGYDASPPGATQIDSPTHPQLLFANNRNPVFRLQASDAVSGVSGYAAVLDKAPSGDPGARVNASAELRYSGLDNGTWYLHARAIDKAGNLGPVSDYGIRIDFNGDLVTADHVKALPNPVRSDQAVLEYELAAPATEVTLEFLNSQGELMKSVDGGRSVGKNRYLWDVSGLANGVYLFRVKARSAEDAKTYSALRKVAVIR